MTSLSIKDLLESGEKRPGLRLFCTETGSSRSLLEPFTDPSRSITNDILIRTPHDIPCPGRRSDGGNGAVPAGAAERWRTTDRERA
jgi:hypothetical protein